MFIKTLSEIERFGIETGFKEAKPTTGGYLGIISYRLFDISEDMKFEVSLRRGKLDYELTTIANDYTLTYTIIHLSAKEIIKGKIAALLQRKKPRDYYDLYFLLRHPQFHGLVNKKILKQVFDNLKTEEINFRKELSILLPISHQMILKDFKNILKREIEKYL